MESARTNTRAFLLKSIPDPIAQLVRLGFDHPIKKEHIRFETELPEDMQTVIERWKGYVMDRK